MIPIPPALLGLNLKLLGAGAVVLALIGTHSWAYFQGRAARDAEVKIENVEAFKRVAEAYRVQVEYGNLKTAEAHDAIRESETRLNEVLKNVKKVTTGRTCLSAPAVRLLNHTEAPTAELPEGSTGIDAEGSSEVATDTHIAEWAAEVQQLYESCAAKLNAKIDIDNGRE